MSGGNQQIILNFESIFALKMERSHHTSCLSTIPSYVIHSICEDCSFTNQVLVQWCMQLLLKWYTY
jgi:hypothetical protein